MKTRNSALFALGLAAALTLGGAMTASAQDTTTRARSQRRIPVRKEQPAPQPARVDTVTITRTDTVVRTRTDTVTVTRVDTVTRIEELPLQRLPGWQFGLGTGMDIPTKEWLNVNSIGWTAHAHLGWFPGTSPVGIRVDGDYSNFGARELDCPNCGSTSLWQLSGALEWRIPLDRKSKVNPQIYFLGGGGFDWFSDFIPYRKQDNSGTIVTAGSKTVTGIPGIPAVVVSTDDGGTFYHWSVGGGVQLGGFFLESQYKSINTDGASSAHVPVLVGWNWTF
jgi:hypothetical protein